MSTLKETFVLRKDVSDKRFDDFRIEPISSIKRITEDAYLENPTWLGGDEEFVCLFIDLDNSSALSFEHRSTTMARLYDYFTQNVVDFMSSDPHRADYIDIKGDGAFGIYEGEQAVFKALSVALSFKTFFDKHIRPKFEPYTDALNCKLAIEKDKILVRKIGKRGDKNNNEVWAGRVVNNAAKLSGLTKQIYAQTTEYHPSRQSLLVISDKVFEELARKKTYTHTSCGHDTSGNPAPAAPVWRSFDCSLVGSVNGDIAWYTGTVWCDKCGDNYLANILA